MRRRIIVSILILLPILGVGLFWMYGNRGIVRSHDTLHLAINKWPSDELLWLAKEKGFFANEGVHVELDVVEDITDIQQALRTGSVDGGTTTLTEVLSLQAAHDTPTKIVLIQDFSNGADALLARRDVAPTLADLRGKRVAVEKHSVSLLLLAEALTLAGLELDDVELVYAEQSDMEATLLAGKADAAVSYPPYSVAIGRNPDIQRLFDSSRIPNTIIDVLVLRADEYEAHKHQLRGIVQAWDRAVRYARAHPDEFRALIMKREGISADEANIALAGLNILSADDMRRMIERRQLTHAIERTQKMLGPVEDWRHLQPPDTYFAAAPLFGAMNR